MTSAHDLRELNDDDLRNRERDLDDQIFRLRIQKSMGQLDVPQKIRELRHDLARVKTVLRERSLPAGRKAASGGEQAETVGGGTGSAARPSDLKG
jgi:large subunit ribosomal protein L29